LKATFSIGCRPVGSRSCTPGSSTCPPVVSHGLFVICWTSSLSPADDWSSVQLHRPNCVLIEQRFKRRLHLRKRATIPITTARLGMCCGVVGSEASSSMKAFILDRYGSADRVRAGDMPDPELREDDVLVEVHAAGVNLLDSKMRNGEFKLILPYRLPLVLGHDVAGVVVGVGS